MRITNGMMINNSLSNINNNKLLMDKLNTQIASTKKIQRPSDDPIAAIRSLRLRSTQSELTQYLEKNIKDANDWMEVTDGALDSLQTVVTDITAYFNQGVSEYQTTSDRDKIITTLKEFKAQLYADGNADDAGRTIFTGFRTDSTLTYMERVEDEYEITENLTLDDMRTVKKTVGVNADSNIDYSESMVKNNELRVVMLAYNQLSAEEGLVIESNTNSTLDGAEVVTKSLAEWGDDVYDVQHDEIVFVPETGELIFGEQYFAALEKDDEFSVTYSKVGFDEGDIRPENYYYCTNKTTGVTYGTYDQANNRKYVEEQEIRYNINFNQSIVINVQGKDVLTSSLGRDLDIVISAANAAIDAHNKIDAINKKIESATIAGNPTEVARLENMLKAAELEVAYTEDNLTQAFSSGITLYTNHLSNISTQAADLGSRMTRLTLNENRLGSQSLTIAELKSVNEDTDLEAAAVEFKEAQDVYDASLLVAAQIVQKSLLDFI